MAAPPRDQRHKPHFHKDQPWKATARAASTSNVNLASPGTTIGGVTMASGDRFVAAGQTTGSQGGVYLYNGSSSAATRDYDFEQGSDVLGLHVYITEGTYAGEVFRVTNTTSPTVGTTAITWTHTPAGGITDHGALGGLADDDHPQYALDTDLSTHAAASDPHTGYVLESLLDAKGDLYVASADNTPARLAKPATDGASLTSLGAATTGLAWQLNNLAASTAPTTGDDTGDGYTIGSRWIDLVADAEYVCTDATLGAAVWKLTTPGGSSGGIGPILLSSDHGVPIVFTDLLQASDGEDLLYASEVG